MRFFYRSDRVRTCGLNIPNVARYQLRHTPIYVTMILYHSSVCLSTKINPLIRTIIFPKPIYSPLERYTNLNKSLDHRQKQQLFLFYLLYEQLYFSSDLLSLAYEHKKVEIFPFLCYNTYNTSEYTCC